MKPTDNNPKLDLSDEESNTDHYLQQAMQEESSQLVASRSEGNLDLGPLPATQGNSGSSTGSLNNQIHLMNLNLNAGGQGSSTSAGPAPSTSTVTTSAITTATNVVATTSTATTSTSTGNLPLTPMDQVSTSSFFSCPSKSNSQSKSQNTPVYEGLSVSKLREIKLLLESCLDTSTSVHKVASDSSFLCTPYNSPGHRRVTRSLTRKQSKSKDTVPKQVGPRSSRSSSKYSVTKIKSREGKSSFSNLFTLDGPSLTQILDSDLVTVSSTPKGKDHVARVGQRAKSHTENELTIGASPPLPPRNNGGRGSRRVHPKTLRSGTLDVNNLTSGISAQTGEAEHPTIHVVDNHGHVDPREVNISSPISFTPTQVCEETYSSQEDLLNRNILTQDPNLTVTPSSGAAQVTLLHVNNITSPNTRRSVQESLPVVPSDELMESEGSRSHISMSTSHNASDPLLGLLTPTVTSNTPSETGDSHNQTTQNSANSNSGLEISVHENDPILALRDLTKNTTFSARDPQLEPHRPQRVRFQPQPPGLLQPLDTWEKYLATLDQNPFRLQNSFSNLTSETIPGPTDHSKTSKSGPNHVPILSLQERLDISIFPAALSLWRDLRNNLGREVTLHLRLNNTDQMISEGLFPAWSVTYAPPPGLITTQEQAQDVAEARRRIATLQLECTLRLYREELEKARKRTQNLKASLAALYGTDEAEGYSLHSALDGATYMANRQRQAMFADLCRRLTTIRQAPEESLWSGIPEQFERPARAIRAPPAAPAQPQQQDRQPAANNRSRSRSRRRQDGPYQRPPTSSRPRQDGIVQEIREEVARIQRMMRNLEGNNNQGQGQGQGQGNRGNNNRRRGNNGKRGGNNNRRRRF